MEKEEMKLLSLLLAPVSRIHSYLSHIQVSQQTGCRVVATQDLLWVNKKIKLRGLSWSATFEKKKKVTNITTRVQVLLKTWLLLTTKASCKCWVCYLFIFHLSFSRTCCSGLVKSIRTAASFWAQSERSGAFYPAVMWSWRRKFVGRKAKELEKGRLKISKVI